VAADRAAAGAETVLADGPGVDRLMDRTGPAETPGRSVAPDYFIRRDGVEFAGVHLLVDLWDCEGLEDIDLVERALREAVAACGATLLNLHLHHFGEAQGVSGVAVLAESHISIHTWPERGFAAVDIFMCGACDPHAAIPVLKRHFAPGSVKLSEARRGLSP
jgi:S-adenosylmethionine decarboxylase